MPQPVSWPIDRSIDQLTKPFLLRSVSRVVDIYNLDHMNKWSFDIGNIMLFPLILLFGAGLVDAARWTLRRQYKDTSMQQNVAKHLDIQAYK